MEKTRHFTQRTHGWGLVETPRWGVSTDAAEKRRLVRELWAGKVFSADCADQEDGKKHMQEIRHFAQRTHGWGLVETPRWGVSTDAAEKSKLVRKILGSTYEINPKNSG
jgi:hypothetical protein